MSHQLDPESAHKTAAYLGDGVYVCHDGYQLTLTANSLQTPSDIIYLEPEVLAQLVAYAKMHGFIKEPS